MAIKVTIDDNFNNPKVRVLMLKGEKGDQGDLNHNDIVDNLTSTATNKVLSAKQGKILKDLVDTNTTNIATNTTNISNETTARQNADNTLQSQITSLASGSPLVASSTSEMIDTTKIYVNTTDGKWYYYDGDSWEIGGTYQSTEIADGTITYDNLESKLQNSLEKNTITTNVQLTKNKWLDQYGNVETLSGYNVFEIDVAPYEVYYVSVEINPTSYGNNSNIYAFKYNNTVVSLIKLSSVTITNNKFEGLISIPSNANKLIINATGQKDYVLKVNKYIVNDIHKNQLDEKIQAIFDDNYTEVESSIVVENAMLDGTSIVSYVQANIRSLAVNPGEKYRITAKQLYNKSLIYFSTENNTFSQVYNNETYTLKTFISNIKDTTEYEHSFIDYEFTIPDYCKTIYINQDKYSQFTIKKATSYKINVDDINLQELINDINPLNNKTIMFTGDSICNASTTGVKGWWRLIQENNPTATVYNYGQDGATIAQNGQDTNDVYTKIQTMYSAHPDADYIIIQGGVNDIWQNIPLGEYIENSNYNEETAYDTTTFSGALEWIFHYALTHFEGKKIGYIVTQKIWGSGSFWNYMERARKICEKWSIPYIDLYNEGDLNLYIDSQRQNYSITTRIATGDGCHPNLAGYQIITPKIENWLKYKI